MASGRYVGNISGGESGGLTLVIASVEGGAVKATAQLAAGGVCDFANALTVARYNTLRFCPPLVLTKDEADIALGILDQALTAVEGTKT